MNLKKLTKQLFIVYLLLATTMAIAAIQLFTMAFFLWGLIAGFSIGFYFAAGCMAYLLYLDRQEERVK